MSFEKKRPGASRGAFQFSSQTPKFRYAANVSQTIYGASRQAAVRDTRRKRSAVMSASTQSSASHSSAAR